MNNKLKFRAFTQKQMEKEELIEKGIISSNRLSDNQFYDLLDFIDKEIS